MKPEDMQIADRATKICNELSDVECGGGCADCEKKFNFVKQTLTTLIAETRAERDEEIISLLRRHLTLAVSNPICSEYTEKEYSSDRQMNTIVGMLVNEIEKLQK